MSSIPPDINLIELLYSMGEVSIAEVRAICRDEAQVWKLIEDQIRKGHAEAWVGATDAARKMEPWEIAQWIRDRAGATDQSPRTDEPIRIHCGPNIEHAYQTEFAAWYKRSVQ